MSEIFLKNSGKSKLISENVLEFICENKQFDVLWISDAHLDSNQSNTSFLHSTLNKYPDAFIIFGGDHHDLMQGRNDRRGSKSALADDLKSADYWNQVIKKTREKIIDKYSDRIICWTTGNHESQVLNHMEFDFVDLLLDNGRLGNRLYTRGWVVVKLNYGNMHFRFPIFFQHAPPSGGKKSKGMLSVETLLAENPDASLILTEHIHQTWIHPASVERLDKNLNLVKDRVWICQMPTLKDEGEGKKQGFYHEKIKGGATTIGIVKFAFRFVNLHSNKGLIIDTPAYIFPDSNI